MDYSYPGIYDNYVSFCKLRGCPYKEFDQWMRDREPPPPKNPTQDFITSALQLATSSVILKSINDLEQLT